MAEPSNTPTVLSCLINGPAKNLPTAINPVTKARINIGLAPALAKIGPTHCCGPNSEIAVSAMQAAMKRYRGFNIALKFARVLSPATLGFGKLCPKNNTAYIIVGIKITHI